MANQRQRCAVLGLLSLSSLSFAQLGIGGSEGSVCASACNIATACNAQCVSQQPTSAYLACICQEGCLNFVGLCSSCCNATDAEFAAYQDPFCGSNVAGNLQTCNFVGDCKILHHSNDADRVPSMATQRLTRMRMCSTQYFTMLQQHSQAAGHPGSACCQVRLWSRWK